jgi:RHS repeat-associated protein
LLDAALAVAQVYSYDAYGNALGFDPKDALTEFLYSGEQFDAKIGQQYLRARYYDPSTGRFNRLDPFFGNLTDPQSLHKYAYVHGDPIQGIDPNGLSWSVNVMSTVSIGARMAVSGGATAFRVMASFASNLSLNLYVRGTVYLTHYASKYPLAANITVVGMSGLNMYSLATSPDPALDLMMGPCDDFYHAAVSLKSIVSNGKNACRSFFVTARNASNGRVTALGVSAVLDVNSLNRGTNASHNVLPPGWDDLNITSPLDRARGHLLANRLGGHGTQENLVTLYQTANIRMRDLAETPVANALASGKYDEVCYFSNAVYNSTDGYPQAVEIIAYGIKNGQIEQQPFVAITILNQK